MPTSVPGGGGDAENEMSIEQLRQKIEEVKAQCRLLEEQKTTQVRSAQARKAASEIRLYQRRSQTFYWSSSAVVCATAASKHF